MNRDYSGLINSTNKAMLEKLKENEHKRGFDDTTFEYAHKRTKDEHRELGDAIDHYNKQLKKYLSSKTESDRLNVLTAIQDVRREAADGVNFPAMIIYKCDKLIDAMESKS